MFTWAGHDGSPYPAGSQQVAGGSNGPWGPNAGVDLGFKTFVQAGARAFDNSVLDKWLYLDGCETDAATGPTN